MSYILHTHGTTLKLNDNCKVLDEITTFEIDLNYGYRKLIAFSFLSVQ